MDQQEIEDWYRELSADFPPYLAGTVEEAWARCLPVWREHGRIEDKPRGVRRPGYMPWAGKFLAKEFVGKFRDDYPFIVSLLSSPDPFIEIAAVELLDFLCVNFDDGQIPDTLLNLKHRLPETIKREVESDCIYRGKGIETVGDLLRCEYGKDAA
jgi:hypothetical protein